MRSLFGGSITNTKRYDSKSIYYHNDDPAVHFWQKNSNNGLEECKIGIQKCSFSTIVFVNSAFKLQIIRSRVKALSIAPCQRCGVFCLLKNVKPSPVTQDPANSNEQPRKRFLFRKSPSNGETTRWIDCQPLSLFCPHLNQTDRSFGLEQKMLVCLRSKWNPVTNREKRLEQLQVNLSN